MTDMGNTLLIWAAILGAIAAGSMVLGAVVGITTPMSNATVGAMCGFGAGALISALAIELVSPTVEALAHADLADRSTEIHHFITLLIALIGGGVIFIVLDQLLSSHGGYLRKGAYVIAQHAKNKSKRQAELMQSIGNSSFFSNLSPALMQELLKMLHPKFIVQGESLFTAGDESHELYILRSGSVTLTHTDGNSRVAERGDLIGEVSFLAHQAHSTSAVAEHGPAELLVLHKAQYEQFTKLHPEFAATVRELASERILENKRHLDQTAMAKQQWADLAIDALRSGGTEVPSASDMNTMKEEHSNAGMAIWLGNLLDVIPESFVIGTVMLSLVAAKSAAGVPLSFWDVMPLTLVGALFLSNFPEALSASVNMKQQGFSTTKIIWLWLTLTIICAVGAAFGAYVGESIPHAAMIVVEGIAAGAMLTMIGSAMLPEAAHLSSPNMAGFSTLVGFVTAVGFKLFE
ncbi:MAG: cyclic nucleotide-binding domain-containing protein [Betaproteobacteria bacterium]|nr:cyclic nucleotide-binding domain-containing protein [Betaproteobacteria bacterium]